MLVVIGTVVCLRRFTQTSFNLTFTEPLGTQIAKPGKDSNTSYFYPKLAKVAVLAGVILQVYIGLRAAHRKCERSLLSGNNDLYNMSHYSNMSLI